MGSLRLGGPSCISLRLRDLSLAWTKQAQNCTSHQAGTPVKNKWQLNPTSCSKLDVHCVLLVVLGVCRVGRGGLHHPELRQLRLLLLHALLPPFDPPVLEPDLHLAGKWHKSSARVFRNTQGRAEKTLDPVSREDLYCTNCLRRILTIYISPPQLVLLSKQLRAPKCFCF